MGALHQLGAQVFLLTHLVPIGSINHQAGSFELFLVEEVKVADADWVVIVFYRKLTIDGDEVKAPFFIMWLIALEV